MHLGFGYDMMLLVPRYPSNVVYRFSQPRGARPRLLPRPEDLVVFVHQHDDGLIFGVFASRHHIGRRWFITMSNTMTGGANQSTLRQHMLV
jgi:hypothetical protein